MMQCLVVQEVEHVLDGERQCAAAVRRAEDRLEQIIHVLLEGTLQIKPWFYYHPSTSAVRYTNIQHIETLGCKNVIMT